MDLSFAVRKIRRFFAVHNRLPTHSEICTLFGYSTKASSQYLVRKLTEANIVEKDKSGRLIPRELFPRIPLLGTIKAGFPAPAEEQLLDVVSIGHYLINRPERSYILKVSGDSMLETGIHPGDFVVIEKDKTPKEGDVVVAQLDEEFTLKYFRKQKGAVYLEAANRKYPKLYPKENLTIFGTVVSVIRKYA